MHPGKVMLFAQNYIITIHQKTADPVWLSHLWVGMLFSGGKFTKLSVRRAHSHRQMLFVRTDRMIVAFHV